MKVSWLCKLCIFFLSLCILPVMAQRQSLSDRSLSGLLDVAYPLETTNPDSALVIYEYIYDRALNQDSLLIAGKALQYSGIVYMDQGDFDHSITNMKEALQIFQNLDHDRGLMSCYNGLANIANFRGEYSQAAEGYENALKYCNDLDTRITITNNIASILQNTRNDLKSLDLLHDLESIFDNSVGPLARAYTYNNIGVSYNSLNNVDDARHYFQRSLTESELAGSAPDVCMANLNIAATFSRERYLDYNQKLVSESLSSAKNILDTLHLPRLEPFYLRLKAEDLYINKQYSEALAVCLESEEQLKSFEDVEERLKVYLLLVDIHKKQEKFEKALAYSENVKLISDSLVKSHNNSSVLELDAKYQTAQREAEMANQEITINRQITTKNYLLGGLGFLGLVGVFLFSRSRLKQKIKDNLIRLKEEKIENLEKQQKLLALDYMVQGQEEERKRIAKDLHDGLGGILTTARLQLRNIEGEVEKLENLKLFERAEDLLKNASEEVRRIAHDMMPDALVNFGLVDAIQDLADKINATEELWVNTQLYLNKEFIPDREATVIYRIIQEILNNSLKHANASEISVEFSASSDFWQLNISDNGIGFDSNSDKLLTGQGINNIKNRVKYLNGDLNIKTHIGEGAEFDILIPKPTA